MDEQRRVDISVSIVSWNVWHRLEPCLRSLQGQQGVSFEILVVDNGSPEGTPEKIPEQFPNVRLIASKRNLGFAAANNVALREAKGDYILFLNPDTLLPPDTLSKTVHYLETHPDVGALGAKIF